MYVRPMGNGFQLRVKHRLLENNLYAMFDDEADARKYGEQIERLLAQGIVPKELLTKPKEDRKGWLIMRCVAEYIRDGGVKSSEQKLLDTVVKDVGKDGTWHINYAWALAWVRRMKRDPKQNLSPSTIRHRVGALARCLDWVCRHHTDILVANPLRLLGRGFATYSDDDATLAKSAGGKHRRDESRNRRLDAGEKQRIEKVLAEDPEALAFLNLALETAMRMREIYTLTLDQINLPQRTIHLEFTKNGDSREIPLSSVAVDLLEKHLFDHFTEIKAREGIVFRWWNGDRSIVTLDSTTSVVSRVFANAFSAAESEDLHFHDMRHEAICQFFIRTTLRDTQIARITGHKDPRMLRRYASLRGSDLATELW